MSTHLSPSDFAVPTDPAIRCADTQRSYPEAHQRIAQIANALIGDGVAPGTNVGVLLWNSVEFLEISAGIAAAGANPVPINWHLRLTELAYILHDSACPVLFAHSAALPQLAPALPDGIRVIEVTMTPALQKAVGATLDTPVNAAAYPLLDDWIAGFDATPPARTAAAGLGMIYTSGTTGQPKGVVREQTSADQLMAMASATGEKFGLAPGTRTLLPAPLYHTAPNAAAMMALRVGADITILPKFGPEEFLRTVQQQRIEQCQMVPTMFVRLLNLPASLRQGYDTASLRTVIHSAGPCSIRVKRAMIDWWGPIVSEYYGGTETGPITWSHAQDWMDHPGTVGPAVFGAKVAIIGADGIEMPPGERGVIYVKSADFWPDFTYLGDHAKRQAMEHDGYVTLGDVGYLDDSGYLFICDRTADMVLSGGVNIYPAEIEAVIAAIPGVRDVAVFGIPDDEYGESLAAHVDVDPGVGLIEDDIKGAVRKELAGYKVPRLVVFDDQLPRDDTGKLFKRHLREQYWTASDTAEPSNGGATHGQGDQITG